MKKILKNFVIVIFVLAVAFFSCDNNNNDELPGTGTLRISLTDDPGDYEAVYVDIEEIRINATDEENSGWVTLEDINAGVYNLMELTNGIDTLLAENEIPSGKISQIRLVLGDKNSVVTADDSVALKTPSAQQSGLKLKVNVTVEPDLAYEVLLDFDAAKSVVEAGNSGNYILKPVIRTIVEQNTGSIKGIVDAGESASAVFAILDQDSIGTFTGENGEFLIKGLDPATYSLYIDPGMTSGYIDSTLTNIDVDLGMVTDVGTVMLEEE